jgi:hypothetical protein
MGGIVLFYLAGRSLKLRIERSRFSDQTKDLLIAFAGVIVLSRMLGRHVNQLSRGGRIRAFLGTGAVCLLGPVILFVQFGDLLGVIAKGTIGIYLTFLVPLLFLPLVNAVFDWLSLAATRLLMATHLKLDGRPKRLLLVFADIGLALILVPALLIAVIATLGALKDLGVDTQIELADIVKSLTTPAPSLVEYLESNARYLWVFGMLFTTLVPTLIHFFFALCTWATQALYLLPLLRKKIDAFVAERSSILQENPNALPAERDSWMQYWLPLFIALAVCLFIGLFGVLYLLLHALIDPGIVWYGNLLKAIALWMVPIEA